MRTASSIVLVVLLAPACDPNRTETPPTAADFCSELAKATLARYAACAGVPVSDDVVAQTASAWAVPLCAQAQDAVANGRAAFDEPSAVGCLAGFPQTDCQLLREGEILDAQGACGAVFRGTVALTGACTYDFDCDGGYCETYNGECTGACAALLGVGASCATGRCAEGLYCDETAHCVARPFASAENGPCGDEQKCQSGLFCSGGLCHSLLTSGPCDDLDECAPEYTCTVAQGATSPTCEPLLALGAECSGSPDACFLGACDATDHCAMPPRATESCVAGSRLMPCAEGYCDGTVCVPFHATGETCTDDFQCGYYARCEAVPGGSGSTCVTWLCAEP